jgi:hypothetical protein
VDVVCEMYDVCVMVKGAPGRALVGSTEIEVAMEIIDRLVVMLLAVLRTWALVSGFCEPELLPLVSVLELKLLVDI